MPLIDYRGFLSSLASLFLCVLLCFPASANQVASKPLLHKHAEIISLVQQYLIEQQYDIENTASIDVSVGFIDSRLKLSHCETPLVLSTNTLNTARLSSGKVSVKVRCTGAKPWTIYVPSSVVITGKVLLSARSLSRGHRVTKNDLLVRPRQLTTLSYGYYSRPGDIIGMEVKTPMRQGQVFTPHKLKAPQIVQRGERVSLVSKNAHFSVKMGGIALGSGASGDRIRVKNLSSKRVVEGLISAPGVVTVSN